jgi:hypothetical protein
MAAAKAVPVRSVRRRLKKKDDRRYFARVYVRSSMARALRLRRPLSQGAKQRSRALHSKRILCDGLVTLVPGATPDAKIRSNGNDLGRKIARANRAATLKTGLREAIAHRTRNISAITRSQFARRRDSVALTGSLAVRSVIETVLQSHCRRDDDALDAFWGAPRKLRTITNTPARAPRRDPDARH